MKRGIVYLISCVLVFGWSGSIVWGQANQLLNPEFDSGVTSWGLYGGAGFTVSVVTGGPSVGQQRRSDGCDGCFRGQRRDLARESQV